MKSWRNTNAQLLSEVVRLRERVVQLEAERTAVASSLRDNRLLNSVLQSISFPLYIVDVATHRIVLANAATCRGDLPRDATCYSLTHHRSTPCDSSEGPCPIEAVTRTKGPVVVEHVHYNRDGHARHVEIHAFPILDGEGNVSQMIEYNVDVTERKRVESELITHQRSLELLVRELKRSNEELRDFTSIAAHDIRSPMVAVSSSAELLKELFEHKLDDRGRHVLGILLRGVNRTAEMVTSLYRCCQVNAGDMVQRNVDLNEVVEELTEVQLAAELAKSSGTVRVPAPLHVVRGDEPLICEVMQNLIANGLKYHRKGVRPEVLVRSRAAGDARICIEVEDNGMGIREADREKVFGMFQRLDDAREQEGLGIGLAFCQRVVERHGGRIGLRSTYGMGSTFWVELPSASPCGELYDEAE